MRDKTNLPFCVVIGVLLTAVIACERTTKPNNVDAFFSALAEHCGRAYEGALISSDAQDEDFEGQSMTMHFRSCSPSEIRIPFHVGEDRSRTWVITRVGDQLRLKHDHRHSDGSEDAITQYGGDSAAVTSTRLEFPVDQYSIEMFKRSGLTASVTNVWALELTPTAFAYELSRDNRFFRVEFDLETPVDAPPPPWGAD